MPRILKNVADRFSGKLESTTLTFRDVWSGEDPDTQTEWTVDLRWLQIAGTELAAVNGVLMILDEDLICERIKEITGVEDN